MALLRLFLGIAQMAGAAYSIYLLVVTGINAFFLIAFGTTISLTLMSLLLFGRSKK